MMERDSEKHSAVALDLHPNVQDVESITHSSGHSSPDPRYRNINAKIDKHILPALCCLYFMAYLDRLNIGSALIFYLPQDLHLQSDQLNIALAVFFPVYIVFNAPANVLLKKVKPHVFMTVTMVSFGLITTLQGLVQNFAGLAAVRVLLGISEAGVFSGCYYIIGMWYPRTAALRRYTVIFIMATVASCVGGFLASAIGKMDGIRGYRSWRWIFILEGSLTCVLSLFSYFTVTNFPEDAKWLSEEERVYVKERLKADQGSSEADKGISFSEALEVFKDYKIFLGTLLYFSILMPSYGLAYFIPTIVATYGYSPIEAQLHSIPIYIVSATFAIFMSTLSDRFAHRFLFVLSGLAIALVGCILLFTVHSNRTLEYIALFIFATGLSIDLPVVICWCSMNLAGHRRRSVGAAFMLGVGESGGILATFAFLATDAPRYRLGYSLCLGFLGVGAVAAVGYYAACRWENRALRLEEERERERDRVEGEGECVRGRKRELEWGYRYFL